MEFFSLSPRIFRGNFLKKSCERLYCDEQAVCTVFLSHWLLYELTGEGVVEVKEPLNLQWCSKPISETREIKVSRA